MNNNPPKRSPTKVASDPQDLQLEDQIRMRSHELYEARGREEGHDQEDWLQAEAELTEKKARPVAA
jgi:hypothetical protein